MTTMQTSIDAYHKITNEGLLGQRQMEVYKAINVLHDCTINDIIRMLGSHGRNTGAITGRISELRAMGVIEACGEKTATTGHRVTIWRTTINLPAKIERKEPSREKIIRLEREIRLLNEELAQLRPEQQEMPLGVPA